MRRITVKIISLLLVLCMMTGCGSSGSGQGGNSTSIQVDDKTLSVGLENDITSLDYAYNYAIANFCVVDNINDFLLRFDENGEMQSSLCTSWEAVDELTYVYQIRDDARFSDGSQMTVEDVIFSMERIRDPETAGNMNFAYANVASIEATGDWEITVKLSEPDALWQYIPATPACQVTSKAYYESHKDNFGNADGLTMGTGAYKVESWKTGSEIVLTKNEYYWGEEPQFEKVIYTVIGDASSMQMAMESGQIDFTILSSTDLSSEYEKSENCTITGIDSIGNTLLSFNCQAGQCSDVNLRRAIASCVDVVMINESLNGKYAAAGTALPFGEGLYVLDPEEWKAREAKMTHYDYDLEKAAQYLDESDYDGSELSFVIIDNNTAYANIAQVIQATCASIGINISIEKVTSSEYYAHAYGNDLDENGNRKYDMMINRWTPDYVDPAGDLAIFFESCNSGAGGANYAAYSNAEVDRLMAAQRVSIDNKERSELMLQACEIAAEEIPYKALYYPQAVYVTSNRISYELPMFWLYSIRMADFELVE